MALPTITKLVATGLLSASLLAACGSSSGATSGPTGTGSAATPTAAAPEAKTISGTITYAGSVSPTHQIVIVIGRQGEQAPAYSAVITAPGPYVIRDVDDGTYFMNAFMDLGDDMGPPGANEPAGIYDENGDSTADLLTMEGGKGLAGVDITLKDK